MIFHELGMSSSQLTNIFQRGWNHQTELEQTWLAQTWMITNSQTPHLRKTHTAWIWDDCLSKPGFMHLSQMCFTAKKNRTSHILFQQHETTIFKHRRFLPIIHRTWKKGQVTPLNNYDQRLYCMEEIWWFPEIGVPPIIIHLWMFNDKPSSWGYQTPSQP